MDDRITDKPPKPWGAITDKPSGMGWRHRGDEPRARRWWKWLLFLGIIPLLVWGYDRIVMNHWVGFTDLGVEFVVIDAGSEMLIPGARVEVQSEGGFYEERDKQEFVLLADAGVARKVCRHSMCFGTQSGLLFTDTFAVHLPGWRLRVSADGYQPSAWSDLDELEYRRQAHLAGPGKAKLVVPVSLPRSPP
jgi:hypothetical protein